MDTILYAGRMTTSAQLPAAGPSQGRTPTVKSAARSLDILEDMAANGPGTLQEMARRMELPKSSLHALLRTMEGRGWIETDYTGGVYSLGIHALIVGSAYLDGDMVVGRLGPLLDHLANETGEAVHLARLDGASVVYLAKRESVHPLRMYSAVGRRLPAYVTALGRSMLAEMPPEQADALIPSMLAPITPHTTTNRSRLTSLLEDVRQQGYAVENEESCLGLGCFAVALPSIVQSRYAISIAVPLARLDEATREGIVSRLLEARANLASQPFHRLR